VTGLVTVVSAVASIARDYRTPTAIGGALFFSLAGAVTAYMLTAALLPLLARLPFPAAETDDCGVRAGRAVVLVACADAPRYDPRAISSRASDLGRIGALDVPLAAEPFLYLAERARFAALGGVSPGPAAARSLCDSVTVAVRAFAPDTQVRLSWTYARPTLTDMVTQLSRSGVESIAVVPLGSAQDPGVVRALDELDALRAPKGTPPLAVVSSLWTDRRLADRMAQRIIDAVPDEPRASTGVALVCPGRPTGEPDGRSGDDGDEIYFTQRVRMLLAAQGFDDRLVRIAWLDWQQPDLTEAVRHLAALGCQRVVVAPATIVVPTVSIVLDTRQALEFARLPIHVSVTVLPPWEDDPAIVDTIAAGARTALDSISSPCGP
jgi:protoheme ferro-lyase